MTDRRAPDTTRAVVTFALTGLVAVILLGVVSIELLRRGFGGN